MTPMTQSTPDLSRAAYVDPTARVFGSVTAGDGASLWPYVVIRAEHTHVRIGAFTNLQDHVMVHIGYTEPTVIGDYCSITHRVVLHGCTIGDNCLIAIGATVMDGAVIGENSIVAGHTFVPEGMVVPPGSIVMGTPARVVARRDNFVANRVNAMLYNRNAQAYARGDHRAWEGADFQAAMAQWRTRFEAEQASRAAAEQNSSV
jgi:carbonic anhydrase/acetyltransferase-like protein (isoleucine patch superfamily)